MLKRRTLLLWLLAILLALVVAAGAWFGRIALIRAAVDREAARLLSEDEAEVRAAVAELSSMKNAAAARRLLSIYLEFAKPEESDATLRVTDGVQWRKKDSWTLRRLERVLPVIFGQMGEPAVRPLISALTQRDPFYLRAWESLFRRKPTLASGLRQKSGDAWRLAATSLEKIGRPAAKALTGVLKDDSLGYLPRREAALCLGRIGATEAVAPLAEALENARLDVAGLALGYLGEEGLARLLAFLESDDVEIRRLAARGLFSAESPEAIEALLEMLEREEDERLLIIATQGLAMRGENRAADRLLEMLAGDKRLRYIAMDPLGRLRDPRALEPLTVLAHDRPLDPGENAESLRGERREAIRALSQIGNEKAAEVLKGLLEDGDTYIVAAAAAGLCVMGREEGREPLVEIAGNTIGAGDEHSEGVLLGALESLGTDEARAQVDSLIVKSCLVKSDEVREILSTGGLETFRENWRKYLFKRWAEDHQGLFYLAFMRYGSVDMAKGYLDCYPWPRLKNGVREWAEEHGHDELAEEAR